jgi:uncharacterized sodium:solute symporter family permease YidK
MVVVVCRYRLLSVYSMCFQFFNFKGWYMEQICFSVCTVIPLFLEQRLASISQITLYTSWLVAYSFVRMTKVKLKQSMWS